jgi:hypothetical protein
MDRYARMLDDVRREVEAVSTRDVERRARHFLAALDPDSVEGMWFEALAEGFPTRLEAAIVYLRDVKGDGA